MSEEHEHKLKFQEKKILKKESKILSIDQKKESKILSTAKEIEEQKQKIAQLKEESKIHPIVNEERIEDSIYKR